MEYVYELTKSDMFDINCKEEHIALYESYNDANKEKQNRSVNNLHYKYYIYKRKIQLSKRN